MTEKTQAHYDMILSFMEEDVWYKASELVDVLGVRETRTKALLRALVEEGLLVDNGAIKGRKYKKCKKFVVSRLCMNSTNWIWWIQ